MNPLVICYSLTGNNRLLAQHLAMRIGCEVVEIKERKKRTVLSIMLDFLFKRGASIEDLNVDVTDHDAIVLVSPIWNTRVATPMRTFIERAYESLPDYYFASLCGHGTPDQTSAITDQLTRVAHKPPIVTMELRIADLMPAEKKDDVRAITSYRVAEADLVTFSNQIDQFVAAIVPG